MLVLGRKAGQTLLIKDNIRVCILEVGSKQIKIGIEAPLEVKVYRNELLDSSNNLKTNNESDS